MSMITCPYCDMEVSLSTIDAQDGCCPECGAFIAGSSSFEDDDFGDYYDDENEEGFDEEDFDDDDFADDDFDDDYE